MSASQQRARSENPPGQEAHIFERESTRLALVFLLAIGLRSLAAARVATIFEDGPRFLSISSQMAQGHWEQAFLDSYHPLYSFLIQAIARFTGNPEFVGIVISVVAGSLCVCALYAFLRQIWSIEVATVGAFLLAIHPYSIRFSASVQSEALYMLLFVGSAALLLWVLDRPRVGSAVALGVVVGFAYLTRPEGAMVGLLGALAVATLWLRKVWSGPTALRVWAGVLVGFALVALPYIFSLRWVTGVWQLSQKKSVLVLMGLMKPSEESGHEFVWVWGDERTWIAGGLFLVVGLIAAFCFFLRRKNILASAVPPLWLGVSALALVLGMAVLDFSAFWDLVLNFLSTLRPELTLLLLLGVFAGALHTGRNSSLVIGLLVVASLVMLFALVFQYGYVSRRHFLPPLLILFGYCAMGVFVLVDWLVAHRLRSRKWALIVVLALTALISLPKAFRDYRGEEYAGRLAAQWLEAQPEQAGLLASERSKSAYYANRGWHLLRVNGQYRPIRHLHNAGVRFVLLEVGPQGDPSVLGDLPRGLRLKQRHRVAERDRVAFLLEIVETDSAP